jgi:hypothetical protein
MRERKLFQKKNERRHYREGGGWVDVWVCVVMMMRNEYVGTKRI